MPGDSFLYLCTRFTLNKASESMNWGMELRILKMTEWLVPHKVNTVYPG